MDTTEPQEPSYYEVALTNRQVLIAFVALLTCLLVAFLAGVWIGRGGAEEQAARTPPAAPKSANEPPIEQLSFFNGSDGAAKTPAGAPAAAAPAKAAPAPAQVETPAPVPAPSAPAPDASEAMRQNLEATMAANRETPAMKMAVGDRTGEAPATAPPAASAPAPAAKPAAAPSQPAAAKPAVTTGKVFVQVYSSSNGARAREIVANLRKAGFTVVLAETPKANGKNFRVRVGPYADKAAADTAAIKLRRDHRLDTWVTDSP